METDTEGEFSYKTNKISELMISLVMLFYWDQLHYKLLRNKMKRENIYPGLS